MKIQNKLTWVMFLFGTLILAGLSGSYYYKSRGIILEDSMAVAERTADQVAHYFEQIMKEKAKTAVALSGAPVITAALVKSNAEFASLPDDERQERISAQNEQWLETRDLTDIFIKARMHNAVADYFHNQHGAIPGEFGEIFLTNRYGVMIATTKKLTTLAHSHKYWWIACYHNGAGRIFFDDRGFDDSVDGVVMGIVVPVMKANQVAGILKCNINILGAVDQALKGLKEPIGGNLKLVRSGGDIVYEKGIEPLSNRVGKAVIDQMKKWANSSIIHDDNGIAIISSFSPVHLTKGSTQYGFGGSYKSTDHIQGNKGEGWHVLVARDVSEVLQPLIFMTKWFFGIGIFFIAIMAIAALYLGKKISSPIIHIARTAEEIGKRNFEARANIDSEDELGMLGDSINKMVCDLQGTTASIDELNNEITERRQAEDALTASEAFLADTGRMANIGGWALDVKTEEFIWTEETYRIHEVPLDHKPQLEEAINFYHPADRPKLKTAIKEAVEHGKAFDMEACFITAGGKHLWTQTICKPVVEEGKTVKLTGTFQDITEHKKLEDNLRHSQKMESIGTLAGGVAHEFNNILGGIIGYAEIAKDDLPATRPVDESLDNILELSNRARDIVKQILTFSRKDRRKKKPLQPHFLINEDIKMLRATIPATIEIRTDIDEKSGTILADPTQIHQVGMNLCANAAQAMERKGGVLKLGLAPVVLDAEDVKSYQDLKPGEYVKLTISDTGAGIDPDNINMIFDPFFTTKEVGKGTGLGLAVVEGITKDHGGIINVSSKPGEGTTFEVFLPKIEAKVEEQKRSDTLPTGTENVLMVDDEDHLVFLMKKILGRLGYKVTALTSSPEALELFKKDPQRFDLLITDLTMPDLTGDSLASEVIAIRPDMPVIIATGYTDAVENGKVKQSGIKAYIPKPCQTVELASTIRLILDGE
ncbi:MAG: response regulator [Deltaproteobacteria bacterium]|nr:response regulator [Deltaproteobacteria bacterium]